MSKKEKVDSQKKEKKKRENWFISSLMGTSDEGHLKFNRNRGRIFPEVNIEQKFKEFEDQDKNQLNNFIEIFQVLFGLDFQDLEARILKIIERKAGSPIQILHQFFLVINEVFFEYEQNFFVDEIINSGTLRDDFYNIFDRSSQDVGGGYFSSRLRESIFINYGDIDNKNFQAYAEGMRNFLAQDMKNKFNLQGQLVAEEGSTILVQYARTLMDWVLEGQELNAEIVNDENEFTQGLFEGILKEFTMFVQMAESNGSAKISNIIHFANPPIRSLLRYINLIYLLLIQAENEQVRRFCFAFFHPSLSSFAKEYNNITTIWQVMGHDFFCKYQASGFTEGGQKNYVGKISYKFSNQKGGIQLDQEEIYFEDQNETKNLTIVKNSDDSNVYSLVQFQNLGRIMQSKINWNNSVHYSRQQNVWVQPKFILFAQYFLNQLTEIFQAQNIFETTKNDLFEKDQQYNSRNFKKIFTVAHLITIYHCEMDQKQLIQVNRHFKIYNQGLIQKILDYLPKNILRDQINPGNWDLAEIEQYFGDDNLFEDYDQIQYENKLWIGIILLKYILTTSIYSASFVKSLYFKQYVLEDSEDLEIVYQKILTYVCELGDSKDEFKGGQKIEKEDGEDYDENYGSGQTTFSEPLDELIKVHFFGEDSDLRDLGLKTQYFTYSVVRTSITFSKKAGGITRIKDGQKIYSAQRRINGFLMGKTVYERFSNFNRYDKPLDYFNIQVLPPLAEKTFTPLVLRPYLCPTFQTIEELHPDKNCVQIFTIFLFYISNLIGEDLAKEDQEIERFFKLAGLNQNIIFKIAQIINTVQSEYGQQINDTVEIKLQFINFDQAQISLQEFESSPRDIINIKIKVKEEYEKLLIIIFKGHLIPIYFDKETDLKKIYNHLQQNQIYKLISDAKKPVKIIQKFEQAGSLQLLPETDKIKMYQNYKKIDTLEKSQQFYKQYFKPLDLKQQKKKILIFYDIETTANLKTTLETSSEMIPYLLVYEITGVGLDLKQINPQARGRYFSQPVKLLGPECTQNFVRDISDIYAVLVEAKVVNFDIIIMGWNSAKFDVQFLLPHLYNQYPLEIDLVGIPSNPKCLSLGKQIKFWDAMQVCSRQTLESFCKSMGVKGKLDCPEIFQIKTVQDINSDPERAQKIINYCVQDVQAMREAVLKFNEKIVALVSSFRGIEPVQNVFILAQTIASTSFKNFTKYLIPPSLLPQPLNQEAALDAARKSYRGGYVQCFAFGSVRAEAENPKSLVHKITYIDINSLYPSVMDKLPLPVAIQDSQAQDFNYTLKGEQIFFHYECQNLYEIFQFKLPKFMCYGFFPIRIFDKNGQFQKIIYPLEWEENKNQKSLWVWGHELKCLVEIIKRYTEERQLEQDEVLISFSRKYLYQEPLKIFPQMGLMYKERLKYKELGDVPMADATKTEMNSLYGKFGQNAYATYFYMNDFMAEKMLDEDYDLLLELNYLQKSQGDQKKLKEWFPKSQTYKFANSQQNLYRYPVLEQNSYLPQQPQQRLVYVSSQIANAARCILLATLYTLKISGEFLPLYSDTDSIIYGSTLKGQNLIQQIKQNPSLLEEKNFPLRPIKWACQNSEKNFDYLSASVNFSGNLGDMKIEKEDISQVKIFAPKFYRVYDKDGKTEDKSKGLNLKMRLDIDEKESSLLNQQIKNKLFDDFENDLIATVFQNQIKSKDGSMIQSAFQKQLTFNLTRKIQPPINNNFQIATIFQNSEEYETYMKKKLINQNGFFIYQ